MKKLFITIGFLAITTLMSCKVFATYSVFDATNNVLATLQKSMDSAFQTIQKANLATLIKMAKEDYAEQVKIYEECVKQYNECVKIYDQAVEMYDWIDTNVGNARNLATFLSCGFSDTRNLQQLFLLTNTTLMQTAPSTNSDYNTTLLQRAKQILGTDVFKESADRGIEMQNYAQASEKVADSSDSISKTMLTKLRTKDQVLEAKVNSGSADLMQIAHANEQATVYIAEELSRMNANISSINRTASKQLEIQGQNEMNKAQEAALYDVIENDAIKRGNNYLKQKNSHERIDDIFNNCRGF